MVEDDLRVITTKLPSYLRVLLQDNCSIKLVFRKKSSVVEDRKIEESVERECTISDQSGMSVLELTGAPLQIDLGNDDSVCSEVISGAPPSWTSEEAKQHPITADEARDYINNELKVPRSNWTRKGNPIYCICDGSDSQHIVILGAAIPNNSFENILVYALPCYTGDNPAENFESMKSDHIKNVKESSQVKYLFTRSFYLYGYNLQNHSNLQNAENNGSVSIDISNFCLDERIYKNSNITLTMQVIVGHSNSPVNSFWEELTFVQNCIDLLASTKQLPETAVISEDCLEGVDIINSIRGLILDNQNRLKVKTKKVSLNLKDLRPENVLDKLWKLLKFCGNLLTLRDCFHVFFEELAATPLKIHLPTEDKSAIAEIASGILAGKLSVPTLTARQSLELMIDLGLEKLKNDYFVIIKNFCSFAEDTVLKKWRSFTSETVAEMAETNQRARRTTRFSSVNQASEIVDLTKVRSKFSYLDNMHKVVEFLFLAKDYLNSKENFRQFCDCVVDEFLVKDQHLNQFTNVKKLRLCEYSLNLFSLDPALVKEFNAVTWYVKMFSSLKNYEVTTVFYYSEHPIFPPAIFGNYEVSLKEEDSNVRSLYVTKLVKHTQKI